MSAKQTQTQKYRVAVRKTIEYVYVVEAENYQEASDAAVSLYLEEQADPDQGSAAEQSWDRWSVASVDLEDWDDDDEEGQ